MFSRRMHRPFMVREIYASWPAGCNRLVQAHPYHTGTDSAPATGKPDGTNLLTDGSLEPWLVGDGDYRLIKNETGKIDAGGYLCIYLLNGDGTAHTVDAYITIEEIDSKEL